MENHAIIHDLAQKIYNDEKIQFISEDQFYFTLGQALNAIFIDLGGIDRHRYEFNYLTNPYIPMPIYDLAKRILKFINKFYKKTPSTNIQLEKVLKALLASEGKFVNPKINNRKAETAFYQGLYHDNLFNC